MTVPDPTADRHGETPEVADPAAASPGAGGPESVPQEGYPPSGTADDAGVSREAVDGDVHAQVRAERDEYLDGMQRIKAEFDNYRRRVERDREVQHLSGIKDLCAELLPVVDNLERALAAGPGADTDQILAGVEMVRGQLASLLGGRGVEEIEASAREFDPVVHEAVAHHPSVDHESGTVIHVAEKGYRLGDSVIRPAKVVVAAPAQDEGPS